MPLSSAAVVNTQQHRKYKTARQKRLSFFIGESFGNSPKSTVGLAFLYSGSMRLLCRTFRSVLIDVNGYGRRKCNEFDRACRRFA